MCTRYVVCAERGEMYRLGKDDPFLHRISSGDLIKWEIREAGVL